jgi:hypothetical protein
MKERAEKILASVPNLKLRAPHQKRMRENSWNFVDKYGFHYGGYSHFRSLIWFGCGGIWFPDMVAKLLLFPVFWD